MNTTTNERVGELQRARLLHTMLRVGNLDCSLRFYTETLGMRILRREDYQDGRFTLAFVGYGNEANDTVLELTHNWDTDRYTPGTAFGHVALEVQDLDEACKQLRASGVKFVRDPGPMQHTPSHGGPPDVIAFIEDPDGYRIELVQAQAL